MSKFENKERILKTAREKCQLMYKSKHIKITSDISAQTLKAKKAWNNITETLREKSF
jgi:hypothetical protein